MGDVEARLRDAMGEHLAIETSRGRAHECYPGCAESVAALIEPRLSLDAGVLGAAWLDHWQHDVVWTWNTHAIAETEHRCLLACADAIGRRLSSDRSEPGLADQT